MGSKKISWWAFIVIPLTLIIGFIIGNYFSSKNLGRNLFLSSGNKVDIILDIIDEKYVESVNMKDLVEGAIPKIVGELDPHSAYIKAEELSSVKEDMDGHFSGIGVGIILLRDTVIALNVAPGGPAEKAGILPGDRIVTIGDSTFTGAGITAENVIASLRGSKDSIIKLGIKRKNTTKIRNYEIARGDVPVNTIDAAYEVSKGVGFIKINKFGRSTSDEFVQSIATLLDAGCKAFIIDLRQNTGGLFDTAVNIVNEFLPQGRLIAYMEGKAFPRNDVTANGTGTCQDNQVVILMDEASASSSEIVAGAIQDNDRGLIIGRRSYGKGLVQNQIDLADGSALRLTIARYYTPSGRCIQRNYEMGKTEDYDQDWINRFTDGELYSQDSIKLDKSLAYKTFSGRTVYGGGGIMPDIFIPRDTAGMTSYYINLYNHDIFNEYAFIYADTNREYLSKYKDYKSLWAFLKTQPVMNEVMEYAESKGIRRRPVLANISSKLIENLTYAYIVRNIFGDNTFYPIYLNDDPVIAKAVEVIKKGEAFPVASTK